MKNDLSHSNSPATGRRYWRSLDELADTPEFKEWLHREFPQGASELDGQNRRHFLKIMAASFAFAGVATLGAGCRRPVEKLEPFGQQPDAGYVFGEPEFFATAMPTRTGAIPLVVKSYDGRPIKIEGNAKFPGGNGGTDRYAQASILDLYDPDRAKRFAKDGKTVSREEALKFLDELSQKFASNQGEGLAFLAESSTSPSRTRLQKIIAQKFPKSQWFTYDAIDSGIHQRAATQAFGQSVKPIFHFDKAKVILSLDCDFLGGEDDCHNHIQKFTATRKAKDDMSRLYQIESLFTLTGTNADHRLRVSASSVGQIARAILDWTTYYLSNPSQNAPLSRAFSPIPEGVDRKWISECAKDLAAAGKYALVVAGQRQPIEVHLLAYAINSVLEAIGNSIEICDAPKAIGVSITDLNKQDAGNFHTWIIVGGNPSYNLSADFAQHLGPGKGSERIRFGYYEDESSDNSNWSSSSALWNFPAAHYLESWGDAAASDGTLVPVQPLIQPLFDGMTELEFLARIAGEAQTNPYEIVQSTFGDAGEGWKQFVFDGFLKGSAAKTAILPQDQIARGDTAIRSKARSRFLS